MITEDRAVDIGEEAFKKHISDVALCYVDKPIMRAYLCGCLAVITHWLISECGGRQAFDILTEMADLAIMAKEKE